MAFGLFPVERKKSWIRLTCVNLPWKTIQKVPTNVLALNFWASCYHWISTHLTLLPGMFAIFLGEFPDALIIIIILWSHKCLLDGIYQISSSFKGCIQTSEQVTVEAFYIFIEFIIIGPTLNWIEVVGNFYNSIRCNIHNVLLFWLLYYIKT